MNGTSGLFPMCTGERFVKYLFHPSFGGVDSPMVPSYLLFLWGEIMLKPEEIKRLIDDDSQSDRKKFARIGQRYYDADHDILKYRIFYYNADGVLVEDKARANSRICHPFFTELADQLPAYMLSFDENPMRAKHTAEGLQDHLDRYFDEEFWSEIHELITGTYTKGFEYLYGYQNAEDRIAFQCADSLGVVEVREKDTDDGSKYFIYWYVDRIDKGRKVIKRIQVHDAQQIYYYVRVDDGEVIPDESEERNPRPHMVWPDEKTGQKMGAGFGFVPFWRLDNNRKQFSGLKPIKGLIDDYDLMECGLSNNLQDFDNPIYVVKGFEGGSDDTEAMERLQTNIRSKRTMGIPPDADLDIKTIDVPYQARKTKADEDEKNIYRFGMGFNASQVGDGNITNVVIRSRYTLLDLKANKLERRLKRLLKDVVRVVLDEINGKHGTDYQVSDVEIIFDRVLPTNEQETAQVAQMEAQTDQIRINNLLNAATVIGDEEVLRGMCEIFDLDFDDLSAKMEKPVEEITPADAMKTLEGVVTDDEQGGETDPTAIFE